MNWTEGTLQRHSRNGPSRLKQKKSLARTRQKLRHGSQVRHSPIVFGMPESATQGSSSTNRSHPRQWSLTLAGQELLPEDDQREILISSGRRIPQANSRNSQLSSPRIARSSAYPGAGERLQAEYTSSQDRRLGDLERKRRELLGRGDWVGTDIQKPLLISFPAQTSSTTKGKWGFGQRKIPSIGESSCHQDKMMARMRPWLAEMPSQLQPSQVQSIKLRIGSQPSLITTPGKGGHISQVESQSSLSRLQKPFSSPRSSSRTAILPPSSASVRRLHQKRDAHAEGTRASGLSTIRLASPRRIAPDLESRLQSLKARQPMAYVEASPATLHQPIPMRMANLDRFGKSSSPALEDNISVSNTEHMSTVDYPSNSSGSASKSVSVVKDSIERAGRSTPIQGPRFDYPPMTDSSHSEVQSLRFLSRFHPPAADVSLPEAPILQDLSDPMKESPYFQTTPDGLKQPDEQMIPMEISSTSPSAPTRASPESLGLCSTNVGDAPIHHSGITKHIIGPVGLWELPAPDAHEPQAKPVYDIGTTTASSKHGSTSPSPPKEATEPIDKADQEWLAFLDFEDDDEPPQSPEDRMSPSPVAETRTEADLGSITDEQSPSKYFTAEDFVTVTTCGSSRPSSPSLQMLDEAVNHHHELASPHTTITVAPSNTIFGPETLPTIYEASPSPEAGANAQMDDTLSLLHPNTMTYEDNRSTLAEAPASEFSLEQSGRESPHASTFAQPRPFVGRFAKTPVPQVRPLVQVTHAPPRRGRPKRKASDGRVSIRGIQNYYDDPIDE